METVFWCWPVTILVIAGFPGVQGPQGPGGPSMETVLVLASDSFCRSGAPGAPLYGNGFLVLALMVSVIAGILACKGPRGLPSMETVSWHW